MGGPPAFHMIIMVDMDVLEHRGVTQLALAAPGDPRDDRDEVRRQVDCGDGQSWDLSIEIDFFNFWHSDPPGSPDVSPAAF